MYGFTESTCPHATAGTDATTPVTRRHSRVHASLQMPSDPPDRQCMLTAVLRQCSSVRLSTAVQGDIQSTMHDLVMLIAAVHQSSCAVSVQTCGRCSIKRQSVAAAHRRVQLYGHGAERLSELAKSSLMQRGRPITAVSGYQLLMLDSPSTGRADDPVVCGAHAFVYCCSNTRFSKALPSGSPTPADRHMSRGICT